MTHHNIQRRSLRERFARFLGERNGKPVQRRALDSAVPLLQFAQEYLPVASAGEVHPQQRPPLDVIRSAVSDVFERLRSQNWEAYVVGGTLRDLMLAPAKAEIGLMNPRDIDVIVLDSSTQKLASCFSELIVRRTRFGGLHLVKKIAGLCEIHFDVWPLAETWAFKAHGIYPEIARFPSTPFLNLDAAAIELYPKAGQPRAIFEENFFEGIRLRTIDINLEDNPFPAVCIIRALIMAAKLQFALSPRLARFICLWAEQQTDALTALVQAQLSHYGQLRCSDNELHRWLTSARKQLEAGSERIEILVPLSRQLGLWEDYPPSKYMPPSDHGDTGLDTPSYTACSNHSRAKRTSAGRPFYRTNAT